MKKTLLLIALAIVFGCTAAVAQQKKGGASKNAVEQKVLGKHKLSLQWISWENFGTVTITKEKNGRLRCVGEQRSVENSDYLTIDGYITIVNEKHLKFEGNITLSVSHIQYGKPCVREGTFDFKSTQGRRYWRMQQMENPCDGCTDYVDIYFK